MADVTIDIKKEDGTILTLDKNYITDITSLSQSTSDASNINYGTIANSGSIQISDGDGYIASLIDDGTLPTSNLDVKIKLNGNVVQEHITTDATYETEDNTLSISMSNFIKDFDELKYKGYSYPDTSKSVYDLLYDVLYTYFYPQYTSETYPDFIDDMFDDDLLTYIKNITIQYPVIEYGKTYREVIDSLCTIAQMNMFATPQNLPKFVSSRPVYNNGDTINQLEWINVRDNLKYTKPVKNKFDGVEMSKVASKDEIDYNTLIETIDIDTSTIISGDDDDFVLEDQDIKVDSYIDLIGNSVNTVCSAIWVGYCDYSKRINKKSEDRLKTILKIYDEIFSDEEKTKPRFTINYKKSTPHNATGVITVTQNGGNLESFNYDDFSRSEFDNIPVTSGYDLTTVTTQTYTDPDSGTTSTTTSTAKVSDLSRMSVTVSLNDFLVETDQLLCFFQKMSLYFKGKNTSHTVNATGTIERYQPVSVSWSIYGETETISFEEQSASTTNIESAKTKATVNSSNLLQKTTKYNDTEIADIIKENILTDYRGGIETGSFAVNANIVEIGDLVKYPEDNRVWRVTGREFVYDGGIEFRLEVMRCLHTLSGYGLYDANNNLIYDWYELIDGGLISVSDNTLLSVNTSLSGVLKISNLITIIDKNALKSCSQLTGVIIPNTVTTIKESAFESCSALESIVIPSSVTRINRKTFYYCSSLTNITLPDTLTIIGDEAFVATSITGITIPNTVTYIGDSVFYYCIHLTSIVIPNTVTYIGDGCFKNCFSFASVTFGTGITFIGSDCFNFCRLLTEIYIPSNIVSIGSTAFHNCSSLQLATFQSPNGWYANSTLLDLSNSSTNATYLTSTYAWYDWTKS